MVITVVGHYVIPSKDFPMKITPAYKVLPLPRVQREAKKLLTREQLHAAIRLAKQLRHYPQIPDLSIERCGLGLELRIEHPAIGQQGWLRAIFWIHQESKTIYIVSLFWKKTNSISKADLILADDRIRKLRLQLGNQVSPWSTSE